ncbi:MAG: transporter substrate-binding domain-containing protein [Elainellaceae cyanobacterium]
MSRPKNAMNRPIFLTTLTVLLGLTLAACTATGEAPVDEAPVDEAAVEGDGDQVLVMATAADYPPYEFYEAAAGGGEPVGFDIDIAKYITDQLGYELEIQDMAFNNIIPALQGERVDFAMAGMTPTEARKQSIDFTDVYYDAKSTIVAPADAGYEGYDDLAGATVGVQLGSIQEKELKLQAETIDGITVEPRNKISELVQEIKAGRIDAAVIENTVSKGYVQNNDDLEFTTVELDGESGSAIAFPQNSELRTEFDQALDEMKGNGAMDELINRWFEAYYEQQGAE